ncbi:AraC family transcriptional regulator [Bacillus licheniformis]|nr:AraC family transcriptional regulator [Bacillus licheniformis]
MLAHSERSIAEIASMVGIANAEYFASLFKRRLGNRRRRTGK